MIVEPKVRGFICTTAHPQGCRENVRRQIEYVKGKPKMPGVKNVLVIGCSTGYGLASRIAAAYLGGAATIGVMFERSASGKRTASSGWYNTAAFEEFAHADGLYAKTINGDAFSKEIKAQTAKLIERDLGQVDMVVYSLASPRRTVADGTTYSSVLKTTDTDYTNKSIDLTTRKISEVTVTPATEQEIADTVKVMGGEDWKDWIAALQNAGVLADGAVTVAYSYIGPEITYPMYTNGSIGKAKEHLFRTSQEINKEFSGVTAYISVNKGLVTQSSAAIPIVPLYISILYKVMKEKGLHEGCIEQMYRLFADRLLKEQVPTDERGMIRLDDWEMRGDVQDAVAKAWEQINDDNLEQLADVAGYWDDFYQMFGFQLADVDYAADVETEVSVPSIGE
ncbi:enoyl-[acyl-carrier-protein] reductase [NADH] [Christensenellaceae bacterium]|nr:enoyl-[acyl-carrier-protein] reductase [NADH] [Christensenellaceae bacterium]BDF62391.1 enoyl-[acyl-carrier-protein] reductase [NADH] [Christensenellaceae bacterium]